MKYFFLVLTIPIFIGASSSDTNNVSSMNVDLNWLTSPGYAENCFKHARQLISSDIPEEVIIENLKQGFENIILTKRNIGCVYEIVIHYNNQALKVVFKERIKSNSEENTINKDYIQWVENNYPEAILGKIKKFRGKKYKTYMNYHDSLKRILSDKEMSLYSQQLIFAERTDPYNFSFDIFHLLSKNDLSITDMNEFLNKILKLKNIASYKYFLKLHLNDLPLDKQLPLLHQIYLIKNDNSSTLSHILTPFLEAIYEKDKKRYSMYIKALESVPIEFSCIIEQNCP
jgi:hypothetical protein